MYNRNKPKEPEINKLNCSSMSTWNTGGSVTNATGAWGRSNSNSQNANNRLMNPEIIHQNYQYAQYVNYMQYMQQMQSAGNQVPTNQNPLGLSGNMSEESSMVYRVNGLPPGRPDKPKLTKAGMTYGDHKRSTDPNYDTPPKIYTNNRRDFDHRNDAPSTSAKKHSHLAAKTNDDESSVPAKRQSRQAPKANDDWDNEPSTSAPVKQSFQEPISSFNWNDDSAAPTIKQSLPVVKANDDWDNESSVPAKKQSSQVAKANDDWDDETSVSVPQKQARKGSNDDWNDSNDTAYSSHESPPTGKKDYQRNGNKNHENGSRRFNFHNSSREREQRPSSRDRYNRSSSQTSNRSFESGRSSDSGHRRNDWKDKNVSRSSGYRGGHGGGRSGGGGRGDDGDRGGGDRGDNGDRGGGGGRGDNGDRGGSSFTRQPRAGDWECPECRNSNFGWRTSCYKCSAERPEGMGTNDTRGRENSRGSYRGRGQSRGGFRNERNSYHDRNHNNNDTSIDDGWGDLNTSKKISASDDNEDRKPKAQVASFKKPSIQIGEDWDDIDTIPKNKIKTPVASSGDEWNDEPSSALKTSVVSNEFDWNYKPVNKHISNAVEFNNNKNGNDEPKQQETVGLKRPNDTSVEDEAPGKKMKLKESDNWVMEPVDKLPEVAIKQPFVKPSNDDDDWD